jgi:hypothetical protein
VDPKASEQNVNENMRRNGGVDCLGKQDRAGCTRPRDRDSECRPDIRARLQAEEEVRRLNEDLQRRAEELERAVSPGASYTVLAGIPRRC